MIAAGSLLEFVMGAVPSFPVGRVEFLHLYPFSFLEFLTVLGQQQALAQFHQLPVAPFVHQILLDLFHTYTIVGGMPEVIQTYAETRDMSALTPVYESIWLTYKADVQKYAKNETERRVINHIMNSAPYQVEQRIKFQHFGNSNYKSREVGEAFRALDDAKIVQLIYPSTALHIPITPHLKKSPRIQFLDTGLLNFAKGIRARLIGVKDMSNAYKGAIIQHIVFQEIMSLNRRVHKKPHFWVREKKTSSAELDLLLEGDQLVIPIEIKSGNQGTLRSLHQFVEQADHPYAIRLYAGAFDVQRAQTPAGKPYFLMNLPYYLSAKLPEYIHWFINTYAS